MKKKFLIFSVTIVLLVVLAFCAHTFLLTSNLSQESSVSGSSEVGVIDNSTLLIPSNLIGVNYDNEYLFWDFLKNVVGLDVDNYNVDQFCEIQEETTEINWSNKSSISATLSNKQATMSIEMDISERKVRTYELTVVSGTLEGSSLKDQEFLAISKNVLNQYRILNQHKTSNFRADYCNEFIQLIPVAVQTENMSADNEKLSLIIDFSKRNQAKHVSFSWYQKIDEHTEPVLLFQAIFTKTGLLTSFRDCMGIYTVATTRVTLSEQEAINLALLFINEYAEANGRTVKSIKAELVYIHDYYGVRGYKHLVYPQWTVNATFDNSDKPGIVGYSVLIWGDTGEAHSYGEQGRY